MLDPLPVSISRYCQSDPSAAPVPGSRPLHLTGQRTIGSLHTQEEHARMVVVLHAIGERAAAHVVSADAVGVRVGLHRTIAADLP